MQRCFAFLFFLFCLAACQGQPAQSAPIQTAAAATAQARLVEIFVETARAGLTQTAAPSATPTVTPSPTIDLTAGTPTASRLPPPTPLSTIPPAEVRGLLEKSLSVQIDSFNGHAIRKVTGWEYGFRDFYWMGNDHLFLNVITGHVPMRAGSILPQHTLDLFISVVNLDSGTVWFPELTNDAWFNRMHYDDGLPRWFEKRQVLILPQMLDDGEVARVYSNDGDVLQSYPGHLLGVSPSGSKLLFADGTWLDFLTGKKVKFNWDQIATDDLVGFYSYLARPAWSVDENKVYICCHAYGDARTGKSASISGAEIWAMRNGSWIFNGRYVMAGHSPSPDIFSSPPLYDSVTNSDASLGMLAGFPANPLDEDGNSIMCNRWFSSSDRKYAWVSCFDGNYLVDLNTFKTWTYPHSYDVDLDWSADSVFAKVVLMDYSKKTTQILSVASKELMPVPDDCLLQWPPVGNILLCESRDNPVISFLDARTMKVQKVLNLDIPCNLNDDYQDGLVFCVSDDRRTWFLLNILLPYI